MSQKSLISRELSIFRAHWLRYEYRAILDDLGFRKEQAIESLIHAAARESIQWERK